MMPSPPIDDHHHRRLRRFSPDAAPTGGATPDRSATAPSISTVDLATSRWTIVRPQAAE
jgi:hypothetical protein